MLTKINNGGYSIWTSSVISTEPSLLLQIKQIYHFNFTITATSQTETLTNVNDYVGTSAMNLLDFDSFR